MFGLGSGGGSSTGANPTGAFNFSDFQVPSNFQLFAITNNKNAPDITTAEGGTTNISGGDFGGSSQTAQHLGDNNKSNDVNEGGASKSSNKAKADAGPANDAALAKSISA
jgi:hypothetical protein